MKFHTFRSVWLILLAAATVSTTAATNLSSSRSHDTQTPERQYTNSKRLQYVDSSVTRRTSTTTTTTTPPLPSRSSPPPATTTKPSTVEDKTLNDVEPTGVTRTIHRTMGGHLLHPVFRHQHETTSTAAPRRNTRLSKVYFQRKPNPERETKTTSTTTTIAPSIQSTTDKVFIVTPSNNAANGVEDISSEEDSSESDDDTELLSDDNRLEAWAHDRLLAASAGDGPELTSNKPKDESKKTLADQVAEGKYGLIQKELFMVPPKRPGVISYASNPEVPNDTAENLGGLNDEDIWLAEDHLLVIKGGNLNSAGSQSPDSWLPIDDYQAPRRPVKLPDNPKVPPPFLVQLDENGPLKFIGNNQFPLINPFTNHSLLLFPDGGGFPQADTHDSDQKNIFTRPRPSGLPASDLGYQYPTPPSPWINDGGHDQKTNHNQSLFHQGLVPPIMRLPVLPPKGGSLDDQNNVTDDFDEDDPSLYYPPPYSFTYDSNYTNVVPPGPLVPGIILPPPPNFFSRQNGQKSIITSTTSTSTTSRPQMKYFKSRTSTTTTPRTTTLTSSTTSDLPSPPPPPRIILKPRTTTQPPPKTTPAQIRTIVRPVYQTTTPRTTTQLRKVVPHTSSGRPQSEILSFVSKDEPQRPLKASPVYFEYYDARDENTKSSPKLSTTSSTTTTSIPPLKLKPATGPIQQPHLPSPQIATANKISSFQPEKTQLRPQKPPTNQQKQQQQRPYNAYLPAQPFDYERYVYITPKPEIIPNGISNHVSTTDNDNEDNFVPLRKVPSRPVEVFRHEVDSIRQTLQYYKDKQRQQTSSNQYQQPSSSPAPSFYDPPSPPPVPQRSPKAKAVYEYSFEAATVASPLLNDPNIFLPPSNYDTTPFKPMVQYSAPLDETDDGFKAMPAYSTTTEFSAPKTQVNRLQAARNYVPKDVYYQNAVRHQNLQQQQQPIYEYDRYQSHPPYVGGISTTTAEPWLSIEKQLFRQVQNAAYPKEINVQIQPNNNNNNNNNNEQYDPYYGRPRNYYNYQPQQPYFRPINRYQQQQHQQYLLQQAQQLHHHHQQLQQQQFQQQQQLPEYNISNDTAVNYLHPRPQINPDAEFIDPALLNNPPRQYAQQHQGPAQPQPHPFPPPPLPQRPNGGNNNRYYPVPLNNPSLAKDMLVNYKLPLPQFNPNAEYLADDGYRRYLGGGQLQQQQKQVAIQKPPPNTAAPIINHHSQSDAQSPEGAHSDVVRYKLPGDQEANVYFYTPTRRQAMMRNR